MTITLEWRIADQDGAPGPINTIIGPDGSGVVTLLPSDTDVQVRATGESQWTDLRTLPAPVDPETIPVVRQAFGGRPNVIPARFYEDGQNELIDPATHPHIMGFTHTATRDGFWSDPTLWDAGTVPGPGAIVSIGENTVFYDHFSDDILKDLLVPMGGRFELATWVETRLRLDYWMTMGVVNLTDTSAESSVPGAPRHEFIFHASEAPGATTRLGAMFMGPLRRRGAKKENHLKVGIPSGETVPAVRAGATEVYLPGLSQAGWRIGHVMMIGGTEHVPLASTDPDYQGPASYYMATATGNKTIQMNEFQFGQEEQRTITGFNGDYALFDEPLVYDHVGITETLPQGQIVTIAPVVGNPCHSIQFRSASFEEDGHLDPDADLADLQKRAHVMAHRCESVDDRYISHKNMARTDTNPTLWVSEYPGVHALSRPGPLTVSSSDSTPIANPNNVRGRYAMHYHWCGGPYLGSPQINCVGLTIWAPLDAPPVPGWGLTQHGTRMAIHDCFAFNVRGAAIVSELGIEIGQWVNNCAMFVRGDGETTNWGGRAEALTNHNDSAGHAFGNQSRAILMHDNIAVSCKYGYVWHRQGTHMETRALRPVDVRFKDGVNKHTMTVNSNNRDEALGHHTIQIPPFIRNIAIAGYMGMTVIHRNSSMTHVNGQDNTPMLIEGFHGYNVEQPFAVPQYSNSYYLKDCLWKRPTYGGSGALLGNVSWNWNFSNMLLIDFELQFQNTGAGLNYGGFWFDIEYRGGGEFSNVFGTSDTAMLTHSAWNVMGDAEESGPDGIVLRRWRSRSADELPVPYPLAPYGYGGVMPSGYGIVEPGDQPYFILGNGVDQTGLNLTLTAGTGRNQGSIHGIVVDSVGMMRWPDWQSSETFPSNLGVKGPRSLEKMQPEQLVRTWGCWNDNGTWKTRAWWFIADRYTHVTNTFHIDFTLAGFGADFLAAHDIGGPSQSPEWPRLEQVLPPQPLAPIAKSIQFLSRTRLEILEGRQLAHRLRYTAVAAMVSIAGGADASLFQISMGQLQWSSNGTRDYAAGGQNSYEVQIRVRDVWGNETEALHQVEVLEAARRSDEIVDDFNRADENLDANPAYVMLRGAAGSFGIRSNTVRSLAAPSTPAVIDMGALTSSDMEIYHYLGGGGTKLLFRMVDADNWLGLGNDSAGGHGIYACVNGTITKLGSVEALSGYQRLQVRGRRVEIITLKFVSDPREPIARFPKANDFGQFSPLEFDPLEDAGVFMLPEGLPIGTKVGLATGWGQSEVVNYLTARAL